MIIPDLTFPTIEYGRREIPIDLRVLLYKGGAKENYITVFNKIASGALGKPINERIELVKRIHEIMKAALVGGGAKATAAGTTLALRMFFAWADQQDIHLSIETVLKAYRNWTDFLIHRVSQKEIIIETAYLYGRYISGILSSVFDRQTSLIKSTRLKHKRRAPRAVGTAADKQNLSDIFKFGHFILDIIESLYVEAIWGPLPVKIRLRNGTVIYRWSRLKDPGKLKMYTTGYKGNKNHIRRSIILRAAWENDKTLRTRSSLVNLRIEAELMLFIAQTGMNLAQAHTLKITHFSYKSIIDGYEVRDYKNRRQGEVLFEIYAEYKPLFERYLAWLTLVFNNDDSGLLFPFIRSGRALSTPPTFCSINQICKEAGVPFIGTQQIRKTRVNWLLRQTNNPDLTAEQAQHTKQILLRYYAWPNLQVAKTEIIKFWKRNDPTLTGEPKYSPAPGVCDGIPKTIPDLPAGVPKPDCQYPGGCLFCEHHRDIDSEDYVWSATTMKHLYTIILSGFPPAEKQKLGSELYVELCIEVLLAKLRWFDNSTPKRKGWVMEALERINEGNFHPHWQYIIESAEGL